MWNRRPIARADKLWALLVVSGPLLKGSDHAPAELQKGSAPSLVRRLGTFAGAK